MMDRALSFGVLGPLEVMQDGRDRAPTGTLQRRLLAMLVLSADRVVSADALCDALWPERLPADHHAALQTHVSRLRGVVPGEQIGRSGSGYRLHVERDAIDANRFSTAVARAAADRAGDPGSALALLDEALALWRGVPYEDLGALDTAVIESERLTELRRRAEEERFDCLLDLGRHADALADIDAFAGLHPLRERAQSQLMTAPRRSGRIVDALGVYDRYRRALAEDLGIEPSPALRQLHDDIVTGAPDAAAPAPSTPVGPESTTPNRSPAVGAAPSSFVGRAVLLDAVTGLLAEHRLVTLLGTGGAGKTRLAHEVCVRIAGEYPDGVWFCPLATADPGTVVATVGITLDVEQRSDADPMSRIADVLRHQRTLIVLDNCEHVIDATAALAERILAVAPAVTVLATSRERLAIDGEHLCPVPPLPLPREAELDEPAIRLFADRATAVRPDWQPTGGEVARIAEICRRLDGLPLAIELAAARLHTLTLDEIAAGLDQRLGMLTGGRRTVTRHRSLAAAITWSYDLLDADEQSMFDAVAVFHGPFTVAGAAALAHQPERRAADTLSSLVERSLLQRDGSRYVMLESMREYGAVRSSERGITERLQLDHALYHLEFAREADRDLRRPRLVGTLDDIDASIADLRAAARHLTDRHAVGELLSLVLALQEYAMQRMRPEVLGWGEQAARLAVSTGSTDARIADAYAMGGLGAWNRGDIAGADELAVAALAASGPAGSGGVAGSAVCCLLATLALIHGRLAEALHWSELEHANAADRGDPLVQAEARGIGLLARAYQGEDGVADDAAELIGGIDDESPVISQAWASYAAGEAIVDIDTAVASTRLWRAMTLARECGSSFLLGVAGTSYSSIEARVGDPAVAIGEYRWLLAHWRRAGVRSLFSTTLRSVAELLARVRGDRPAAVLLGSVLSSDTAHDVFGEDSRRLAALAATLSERLGPDEYANAVAEGRTLDDNDAAVALEAFDHCETRQPLSG